MKLFLASLLAFLSLTPALVLADAGAAGADVNGSICQNFDCKCFTVNPITNEDLSASYPSSTYTEVNSDATCKSKCLTTPDFQGIPDEDIESELICIDESLVPTADEVTNVRKPAFPNMIVDLSDYGFSENSQTFQYISAKGGVLGDEDRLSSNLIGDYVKAIYLLAISVVSLAAVIQLMVAGVQWATARGDAGQVTSAKKRIQNSVFGLILLLLAYNIAFIINPDTTKLESLSLQIIPHEDLLEVGEATEESELKRNPALTGNFVEADGDHIINIGNQLITPEALAALNIAANKFYDTTHKNVRLTSAVRSLDTQASLFYNNCLIKGGKCNPPTCNPMGTNEDVVKKTDGRYALTGELALVPLAQKDTVIQKIVENSAVGNCAHPSGIALDVWPEGSGNFIANPAEQQILVSTMIDSGFCRLSSEVWHFELLSGPPISTSCSTGNNNVSYIRSGATKTPTVGCSLWDFNFTHKCQN